MKARTKRIEAAARLSVVAFVIAAAYACSTKKVASTSTDDAAAASMSGAPSASAAPSRPGMVFVPAGDLHAGTPKDKTPRIADEEMPGTTLAMHGFYIDQFPYPNEAGAIPTSNLSRDDAAHACESKGKRLCTELEWERACKGPDNTSFVYGDVYKQNACGTGASPEIASKRPTGEHNLCKSAFGVSDMHGGVWEWTSSEWGRGASDPHLGALRGGNAIAGEVVDRCANGLARSPETKSATIGFRCCAGDRNAAEVSLSLESGLPLEWRKAAEAAAPFGDLPPRAWDDKLVEYKYINAIVWRPMQNDPLSILVGCSKNPPKKCGVFVGSSATGKPVKLAALSFGASEPEIVQTNDKKVLRARAVDRLGLFGRDILYSYGRVEFGPESRP